MYFAVELGGTPPLLHAGDPKIVRWEPLRLLAHVQCLGKSPPDTLIVAPLRGTVFNGSFTRVADTQFYSWTASPGQRFARAPANSD